MLIAGNWKMNKTRPEAVALAEEIVSGYGPVAGVDVAICPPAPCLDAVGAVVGNSGIKVGAQNVHAAEAGAYTGEVSAGMLRSVGCRYVIVGHSERRQYFGESDGDVNAKARRTIEYGMVPIVCVGEHLEQRESGKAEDVVRAQVLGALDGITVGDPTGLVIAYEPVWAIGTGVTASPGQAQEMHAFIRQLLIGSLGDVGSGIDILYGGSMKPNNASELLSQGDVNGGLIGGASLDAASFAAIIAAAVDLA